MQAIYNYIPATNHVSRVYNIAAVLYLQFVLHVHVMLLHQTNVLYCHISTSPSLCAVPNMVLFCTSLITCFSQYVAHHFHSTLISAQQFKLRHSIHIPLAVQSVQTQ
jgi:hypothetical protein